MDMILTIQEDPNKGFVLIQENELPVGKMTYSKAGDKLIVIDSTYVDEAYRGQDAGKKMLYKIVEMARVNDIKIIPLCPFASYIFTNNVDIQDVLR